MRKSIRWIPAALTLVTLSQPALALGLGEDDLPAPGSAAAAEEAQDIQAIADLIQAGLQKKKDANPDDIVQRDAHPKAHGCVKAWFSPLAKLPAELAHGVFAKHDPYPAWIRYSNGNPDGKRADSKGDARGMAIKLMGVKAGKDEGRLDGDENSSQDFLLSNYPQFFIRNPSEYRSFFPSRDSVFANVLTQIEFFGRDLIMDKANTIRILFDTFKQKVADPFQIDYYSQTPYRLGPESLHQAVKYRARHVACGKEPIALTPLPQKDEDHQNFLREAMIKDLKQGDVCFDFEVQLQTNPVTMPVSDSTVLWQSKFRRVARILIKKSENDGLLGLENEDRTHFCENVAMSPWHGLTAHQPLGSTNRVRKTVYQTISRFRRQANHVEPFEPTGQEQF
jgi:catalase